jgi:hypothetical protein
MRPFTVIVIIFNVKYKILNLSLSVTYYGIVLLTTFRKHPQSMLVSWDSSRNITINKMRQSFLHFTKSLYGSRETDKIHPGINTL